MTAKPASRRSRTWRRNAGSAAGMITPRVSARMRWRTIAATGRGAAVEASAASRSAGAVGGGERRRQPGADEVAELRHRPARLRCAQHLVGEGEQELASTVVAEQPAEPVGAPALACRRLGAGDGEQPLGAQHRGVDAIVVRHASIQPAPARATRWPCCAWSATWSRTSSCAWPRRRSGGPTRQPRSPDRRAGAPPTSPPPPRSPGVRSASSGACGADAAGERLVAGLAALGVDVRVQREGVTGHDRRAGRAGRRADDAPRSRCGTASSGRSTRRGPSGVSWIHVPAYSLCAEPIATNTSSSSGRAGARLSVDVSSESVVRSFGPATVRRAARGVGARRRVRHRRRGGPHRAGRPTVAGGQGRRPTGRAAAGRRERGAGAGHRGPRRRRHHGRGRRLRRWVPRRHARRRDPGRRRPVAAPRSPPGR